ncbi:MAG: LuxR C-terminal-related transcriptional regulator [Bdellovibrionaceae bacterium]|nr:LuxR C-terminal-related transcriptional regulator [Pseudobdellovibrionaceae bacterium]
MPLLHSDRQKVIFFACLMLLAAFDLWFDFKHGIPAKHLFFEIFVLFVSILGFNYFVAIWYRQEQKKNLTFQSLHQKLQERETEIHSLQGQVKTYKEEFRGEVERTFRSWGLTKSESDVAGFLLKGLSLKEIADLRSSNERTVRAQCGSIYKKSKLNGRSQLSSYFLDDMI